MFHIWRKVQCVLWLGKFGLVISVQSIAMFLMKNHYMRKTFVGGIRN